MSLKEIIFKSQYFPLVTTPITGLISLLVAYCGFRWSRTDSDKREK